MARKIMMPIYLNPEQVEAAEKKATKTGRPRAAIIREWIDRGRLLEVDDQVTEP